ncbi:MAG TPA: response regulator transcription factor [Pseudonocardiaceae bacterium]|nr:response regulator transcription factor [Pseudonocardiaceae bacterium]
MTDLVLADDHAIFVDALSTVLTRQGFIIAAVTNSLAQTVTAVGQRRPHVCLIDRHFGDGDSIGILGRLITSSPRTKILMLSADRDPDGMAGALGAGASGYLHKTRPLASLTSAIGDVLRDKVVVDLPSPPPERRSAEHADAHRLAAHLTGREWQCLELLIDGFDTTTMARRLGVSRTTVRTHVQALLTKLGVHSRLEAASFAVRHKLLAEANVPARAIQAI